MKRYQKAGCAVADVLLPREGVDLKKWAVVACDQFTSQPEYWKSVDDIVGDAPSTLRLIYPEVFLGEDDGSSRIHAIRATMQEYLDEEILEAKEGLIYLERETGDGIRRGVILALDLEQYDYSKGSTSLVRATEGTIVERLPPRMKIREGAPLEFPHIMVLIDDPTDQVIGPLAAGKEGMTQVYDFELMLESGHLSGWCVEDPELETSTMEALARLGEREVFEKRYSLEGKDYPVLLYAMGDGNHSLATAKAIWEKVKSEADDPDSVMDNPARYALVELVNVHDESLVFEPIHRVLFQIAEGKDLRGELRTHFEDRIELRDVETLEEMTSFVDSHSGSSHAFGMVTQEAYTVITVRDPAANLAVGTLQSFLDGFMQGSGAKELDYVHETAPVASLGQQSGNAGFYLPGMSKQELFESVILDGALPRKTFSMGESKDKRFYFEGRRLT